MLSNDESVCPDCGHSLVDNEHGVDQNDYDIDYMTGELIYLGTCTYCKECQKHGDKRKEK